MFKIDTKRKIVLENGLIEVERFPRDWKIGANQLWNLGRENALKLVRVMDPNFKDARIYMSERVEEPGPGVVELPRYYAIGINKKGDWYTEDAELAVGSLPQYVIERARQKFATHPLLAAIRDNGFVVFASSLLLVAIAGLLTGGLIMPNAGLSAFSIAMTISWFKVGLPFWGVILTINALANYFNKRELEEALEIVERPPAERTQPLPSSELV